MDDYKKINKTAWNLKADVHIRSGFYGNEAFLQGGSSLKSIERDILGDIAGETILHLQCHFGQDSISLSRLGAKVTGIDLSDRAIDHARAMAAELADDTKFIGSDVYDLPNVLDEKFDIVFTSYGVIGWLPDMEKWARVIAHFLKPGGRFIMAEFHPVVWMFDDDFKTVAYNYFNTGEIVEQMEGTYADRKANIEYTTVCWNHSLSEVIGSLIRAGIRIGRFEEFDYSPYDCFRHTLRIEKDKYRIRHLDDKLPMVYALEGIKD